MTHHLLLFTSTRDVLRAERACRSENLTVRIIPVPRNLSSDCGMALRVEDAAIVSVKEVLKNASIDFRE